MLENINLSPINLTPIDPARAGQKKQIGSGKFAYTAFLPVNLQDVKLTYSDDLVALIGKARATLSTLTSHYQMLPEEEKETFTQQMIEKEAAASLKLVSQDFTASSPDFLWLKKVIPYSFTLLDKLPISRRLLLEIHDMALHDPSHYRQTPGEFRRSPIWIGKKDATLTKGASFVPPAPDDMTEAISALEHFINEETTLEPLVKSALIHYQLEMIHPFLDGNGRVGRLVNSLYLKEAGLLPAPILPLSSVLLEQSFYYYAHLLGVENRGAYETWIQFWLKSTQQAAQTALETLSNKNQ